MTKAYLMIAALIAIVGLVKIYEPKIKGFVGEKKVSMELGTLPPQYKILNDVLLKTATQFTQIDHIVISPKGIFVIETKNYEGWIFGSDNQRYWTVNKYGNKNKFFNPVWQNKAHIKALQELLGITQDKIFNSIVAFSGKGELKKISTTTPVMYIREVGKYIENYGSPNILNELQVNKIYNIISKANLVDDKSRREHVNSVRKKSS